MNLPIRKSILFLFSLITFFSCENPTTDVIGLEENALVGTTFTDTVTIRASTVVDEEAILALQPIYLGSQRTNLLVGKYPSNVFGTVTSRSFLELELVNGTAGSTFKDAANATIDSVVLALDYDEYYGDTTQDLTIQVHRLTEGFKEKETYFTNKVLAYNSSTIGSKTFKPLPRKVLSKRTPKKNAAGLITDYVDTLYSYPVRVRLDNTVGSEILAQSGKTPLSSTAEFVKFFPGLAITATDNAKSLIGLNLLNGTGQIKVKNPYDAFFTYRTYLTIYYKAEGKNERYNFAISRRNYHHSQLATTRTGSTLAALQQSGNIISSTATNNEAYLQESVGIKTKIEFPHLHKLRNIPALRTVAINRAELVIPVKTTADNTPSPFLFLFETDNSNKILRSNGIPHAVAFDGIDNLFRYGNPGFATYNEKEKAYIFNVTSYVQAIAYNSQVGTQKPSRSFLLSPATYLPLNGSSSPGSDALALQTLQQTVLSMDPSSSNKIKLRLYYTTNKQPGS